MCVCVCTHIHTYIYTHTHIHIYERKVSGSLLARCVLSAVGTHQDQFGGAAGRTITGSFFPKMDEEPTLRILVG